MSSAPTTRVFTLIGPGLLVAAAGIARWQLASGMTAIEGWTAYLPGWVRVSFACYLVIWTISVSAALTSASGLGIATLTSDIEAKRQETIGRFRAVRDLG